MPQPSALARKFGHGGTGLSDNTLRDTLNLVLGTTVVSNITGVVAATGYSGTTWPGLASLRRSTGDVIVSVLRTDGTGTEDSANCTINETRATGTVTISGNPVDGDTVVVGRYTYTFKTTPTALGHVKITAGNNNQMAT